MSCVNNRGRHKLLTVANPSYGNCNSVAHMGPEIPIRLAPRSEAAEVTRLLAAFRDYYGEAEPPTEAMGAAVEKLFDDPATEYLLAGEPACAVAQLRYRLSVWTGAEDCWLEDLFVEEAARGEGVGRALTEACVHRARQRGCRRIQLDANDANGKALALYRDIGFEAGSPARWDGARDLYFTKRLD